MFARGVLDPSFSNDYNVGFGFEMSVVDQDDFVKDCSTADEGWDNILCEENDTPDTYYMYGCEINWYDELSCEST